MWWSKVPATMLKLITTTHPEVFYHTFSSPLVTFNIHWTRTSFWAKFWKSSNYSLVGKRSMKKYFLEKTLYLFLKHGTNMTQLWLCVEESVHQTSVSSWRGRLVREATKRSRVTVNLMLPPPPCFNQANTSFCNLYWLFLQFTELFCLWNLRKGKYLCHVFWSSICP